MPNARLLLVLLLSALAAGAPFAATRGVIIEDFESGSVALESYPGQDADPSDWTVTSSNPYAGSYALRLFGNTWKIQRIPAIAIAEETVWQAAAFVERLGEMQAFGVGDSLNELFYTFAGEQLPQESKWWTVYQGAFPEDEWYAYLLPIGRDWKATYGYLPTIDRLFYANDDDEGTTGIVLFDEIADVTEALPVPPEPSISYVVEKTVPVAKNLFLVGVQFYANVFDPDSDVHTFSWDFGDGGTSGERNPTHEFLVEAHYTYTVGLLVRDESALAGTDTCQVRVEPGAGDLPITVNFVGDVFTGRGYETPGGIIATQGIEALFEPTLSIFGNAADVNVCNLECAYTNQGTPHPTKSVVFRSRPENIAGIAYAGVDLVTTANNHIIDYGEEGMLQTFRLLDSLDIRHSGAGTNEYFALLPTFYSKNGVRMAFLGQCNRCGRKWNYQPFLDAGASKPGFAYFLAHNVEAAVASAREAADIVVIQTHSGDEYDTAPPEKGGRLAEPFPVEANAIGPGDPDFRFRVEPSPGDRALRRLAADLGADVVINHHPHVLQGFESHNGKLIAHSLGNFVFDLYYPETMPTIVLTLAIDKEGIVGYSFVPAWIDDWIPRPATGTLGREIVDRMADYSRPMGAIVAPFFDKAGARIYLDRAETDSTVTPAAIVDSLFVASGGRTTPPLALEGKGNLSAIRSIEGPGSGWEVRWGREILWHGVFEEEGATFWDLNSADEWLDTNAAHSGARSLALRRSSGSSGAVGADLEKHLPCDPANAHSILGYMKAENAGGAWMSARFYSTRHSETPVASTNAAPSFSGTCDWVRQWKDLDTPSNGVYFEVRCSNDRPASGTGHAWFDDLAFIEWEPWVAWNGESAIPSPNNFRFLQVRSMSAGPGSVIVEYSETAYEPSATSVGGRPPAPAAPLLQNFPNPFNARTTIELSIPGEGKADVRIEIFDIRGRRIATVHQGEAEGGTKLGVVWKGTDARGREVPSGVYLVRAAIDGRALTGKIVLLR